MNIVLIGYRCCGKTSAGKLIAEKLVRQFVDTDELIAKKTGTSIDKIVSEYGWEYFRDIEKDVIKEVSSMENAVIATGGGVVTDEDNVKNLKKNGFIVWLRADVDTIQRRLKDDKSSTDNRPSLTGGDPSDEINRVLEEREPLYLNTSNMAIDTTELDINEVADMIIKEMEKRNGKLE